jgi:FkbM family methyltransferase
MRESFGFIDDTDAHWSLRKQIHRDQARRQRTTGGTGKEWFQTNWQPSFSCGWQERIGPCGEGGKWICDPFRIAEFASAESCLVYSIGSNGDFGFEEAVHTSVSPKCEIHTFDPDPRFGTSAPHFVNYHPLALGKEDGISEGPVGWGKNKDVRMRTIDSIVRELNHSGRPIELLKIDCEGCEYLVSRGLFTDRTIVRQYLIEIHDRSLQPGPVIVHGHKNFDEMASDLFGSFAKRGYVVFHKEPNLVALNSSSVEYGFLKLSKNFTGHIPAEHLRD